MKAWVLLLLVLLSLTTLNYLDEHEKWVKCSFKVDAWQLGYDYCMLGMVIAWMYATVVAARGDQSRRRLKWVFAGVFPGVQVAELVYIVWGTYKIVDVMDKEKDCVRDRQLPIATWKMWANVVSIYVSWLVLSVLIGALVSSTQAIIFAFYTPMLNGLAANDFQVQLQIESGLSQEFIDRISEVEGNPNDVCSICLENFTAGELIKRLPTCNHQFHRNCIQLWLLRSQICPFCKHHIEEHSGQV